jgi:phage terminase small subunit
MRINGKMRVFIDEYLSKATLKEACAAADVKKNTASSWLKRPEVKAELDRRRAVLEQHTNVKPEMIMDELARIAFGDLRKVASWKSNKLTVTDSDKLTTDDAAMISEISEDANGSIKLKRNDKLKALELLGKQLGMFKTIAVLEGGEKPIKVVDVAYLSDDDLQRMLADADNVVKKD